MAVGLGLAACGGSLEEQASAGADSVINTELWYAPTNFDPATASGDADVAVARLGFDTLLRDGEDGLVGGLATDWTAVSGSKYEFSIRDDATCSDGTTITPTIIANSLQYVATSQDSGAQSTKAAVFGTGTPTFTPDDAAGTLVIELSTPYAEVLSGLATENTGIICPAGLADPAGLAAGTVDGAWSGPYTLDSVKSGVSASYALRSDYDAWPAWTSVTGTPAKTINITVSKDSNTSANLLSSGGVDVTRFYGSDAERFTADDGFSYVTMPSSAYTLIFNEFDGSPFQDQALRTAVAASIDPEGFNDAGLDGLGTPLTTVTASTVACTVDGSDLIQAVDPTTAAALAGQTVRLLAMSNWDPAIDYLAESMRAAGATVEVSALDPADWQQKMRTEPGTWDIALNATDVAAPLSRAVSTYLGPTVAEGGRNIGGADNPQGYQFLQDAQAAGEAELQCESFQKAQQTILERRDMVPLITDTHYVIARDGFASSVFSGYWDISSLRLTNSQD
ncbi:ABC transporter substrate-binding protein [Kineococcus arenarius]|uniref:ABC transporter substrate-binding protein n=1 Tax=unclassified Kineococcus TaxID=2621656 RepID=UPI003D7EB0EA